ncbi:MAG TPA: hypothetical protein VKM55_22900 [Candidatus Lokiarchaeia archaeon]|nr:hypothetical protein [Candidatus Lokiarchaeia archaeon]
MPESIEISKNAHDLWQKMLEQKEPVNNAKLKQLFGGKAVSAKIKEELISKNLITLVKTSPQEYRANPAPANAQIVINQEVKPAKPARKPRPPKVAKPAKGPAQVTLGIKPLPAKSQAQGATEAAPTFSDIMMQVGKFCKPYFDRIDQLTTEVAEIKKLLVGSGKASSKPSSKPDPASTDMFYESLRSACAQLDETSRFGGEIPLPDIWTMMSQQDPGLTWNKFKEYLFQLDDSRKIDLHVANDPSKVRHPEKGISVPGRGLIYYIALRE